MLPEPVECRRWFSFLVGFIALAVAVTCLQVVRSVLPTQADGAHWALTLLFVGAVNGFVHVLKLLLPLLLIKLWPELEDKDPSEKS